jgi:hypothetical protein
VSAGKGWGITQACARNRSTGHARRNIPDQAFDPARRNMVVAIQMLLRGGSDFFLATVTRVRAVALWALIIAGLTAI